MGVTKLSGTIHLTHKHLKKHQENVPIFSMIRLILLYISSLIRTISLGKKGTPSRPLLALICSTRTLDGETVNELQVNTALLFWGFSLELFSCFMDFLVRVIDPAAETE